MAGFNRARARQWIQRLDSLQDDCTPAWGSMSACQMLGHLRIVLLYTMGHGPEMPFRGNWFSRHLFRHPILHGVVPIPKNIKLPRPRGMKEMPPTSEATREEMIETLHEYLDRYERGELPSRTHPFFGVLGAQEWNRFHTAHFRHHFKQFRL